MHKNSRQTDGDGFAKTVLELAGKLEVDKNRIYGLRSRPDAPGRGENGMYSVEEWREFLETMEVLDDTAGGDADLTRLKKEYLQVRTALARHDLAKKQDTLITQADYLADLREIIGNVNWLLNQIPTRAALLTTDKVIINGFKTLSDHLREEFRKKLFGAEKKAEEAERLAVEVGAGQGGQKQ